jgi:hypothetical protein
MTSIGTYYNVTQAIGAVLLALFVYVYTPYLLPRTAIPHIAAALRDVLHVIERAEDMEAIPSPSLARRTLDRYEGFVFQTFAMIVHLSDRQPDLRILRNPNREQSFSW